MKGLVSLVGKASNRLGGGKLKLGTDDTVRKVFCKDHRPRQRLECTTLWNC